MKYVISANNTPAIESMTICCLTKRVDIIISNEITRESNLYQ